MMTRRSYSLRLVLAVSLVGLQFIAISAVIFFTFLSSERALLRQSNALLAEAGANVVSEVRSFLAPARQTLDVTRRLAENNVLDFSDDATLESHLFQQLLVAPQISGLYFSEPNGRFVFVSKAQESDQYRTKIIDPFDAAANDHPARFTWRNEQFETLRTATDPADPYDARTRPWFTAVQASRSFIWTDPYIYFTTRQPGITYAAPVLDNDGELLGILGVDIAIDAISGFLADIWSEKGGSAIIMNRNGEVLAHPELQLIRNDADQDHPTLTVINDIEDQIAQAVFGNFPDISADNLPKDLTELSFGGERFVALLVPVPEPLLNWTIGIYAPVDTFIGEIQNDRIRWIWFAGIVAALTGLVGLRLADWINRPLRDFASGTKRVSQGNAELEQSLKSPYTELAGTGAVLIKEIRQRQRFEVAYGRTFDLTSRGMAQIEPETGRFLRVNGQLADLLASADEQLSEQTLFDFSPSDPTNPLFNFNSTLRENSEFIEDIRFVLPNGRKTWLRVNAILILDEDGNADHAVAIFDDVNAEKQSAALTVQLNRDLSHLARVNVMGEMASGMAHELNQPLSAIVHNADAAQLALRDLGLGNDEVTQICADMERQALRAGDIIRALRDIVRKDRGRMAIFDVVDLCTQTLKIMEVEARARGIRIIFAHDSGQTVYGNRTQIAQVLVNLLRNAIDAMAAMPDISGSIDVAIFNENDVVRVCITDQGPGVAQGTKMFQKFNTFKPDGMGLGLSICRTIVEAHGGEIWHEVPQGGGAVFCFTMNREQSPDGAEA